MPGRLPTPRDIEPLDFDPMLDIIRMVKELATRTNNIPNPLMKMMSDITLTATNQAEAMHLTLMGLLRLNNFINAGGINALQSELLDIQKNPAHIFDLAREDVTELVRGLNEELRRNFGGGL